MILLSARANINASVNVPIFRQRMLRRAIKHWIIRFVNPAASCGEFSIDADKNIHLSRAAHFYAVDSLFCSQFENSFIRIINRLSFVIAILLVPVSGPEASRGFPLPGPPARPLGFF